MKINQGSLKEQLAVHGVKVYTNTRCEAIEGNSLLCSDPTGSKKRFDFDYALVALGTKSNNELNDLFENAFPEVYFVGDCVDPGRIHVAIHQGYLAGARV